MTPEDAWRDNRAACDIKCREAREDERRRIVEYLRRQGDWGAVAAAAIEGDDYWKRERAELARDRRQNGTENGTVPPPAEAGGFR